MKAKIKDAFHLPGESYHRSHSVGAQPKTWSESIEKRIGQPWREDSANLWPSWLETVSVFRQGLAPIIGANPKSISPQPNVTAGISKILSGLPPRKGRNRIVLSADDFPTVGFALERGRSLGYELEFLPKDAPLWDVDAWSRAFDDDVQLVSISHVYSNRAVKPPVEEIIAKARAKGVYTLIDVAQSAGAVPVDFDRWGADFVVGTSQKYLCGGPGAGFLAAREDLLTEIEPFEAGWHSHERPYEFDIHAFEFASDASRFLGGTPGYLALAGASAAHAIFADFRIDEIFEHNQALLDRLIDGLSENAFLSETKKGARGCSAVISVRDYETARKTLFDAGVIHDTRMGGVRISMHLYNDEHDVDRIIDALAPLVRV